MSTAKKLYATRDFNDAGTERAFTAGQPLEPNEQTGLTQGMIDNYAAAGLAGDKPAEKAEATSDDGKVAAGKPASGKAA